MELLNKQASETHTEADRARLDTEELLKRQHEDLKRLARQQQEDTVLALKQIREHAKNKLYNSVHTRLSCCVCMCVCACAWAFADGFAVQPGKEHDVRLAEMEAIYAHRAEGEMKVMQKLARENEKRECEAQLETQRTRLQQIKRQLEQLYAVEINQLREEHATKSNQQIQLAGMQREQELHKHRFLQDTQKVQFQLTQKWKLAELKHKLRADANTKGLLGIFMNKKLDTDKQVLELQRQLKTQEERAIDNLNALLHTKLQNLTREEKQQKRELAQEFLHKYKITSQKHKASLAKVVEDLRREMEEQLGAHVKKLAAMTDHQFTELETLTRQHHSEQIALLQQVSGGDAHMPELLAQHQAALAALEKERHFTQEQLQLYLLRIRESLIEREKKAVVEGAVIQKKTKE